MFPFDTRAGIDLLCAYRPNQFIDFLQESIYGFLSNMLMRILQSVCENVLQEPQEIVIDIYNLFCLLTSTHYNWWQRSKSFSTHTAHT